MPRRRQVANSRPVHVFLDEEPPPELVDAARRGECWLIQGKRPDPVKLANVLVRVIDAQIKREDEEQVIQAMREAEKKTDLVS